MRGAVNVSLGLARPRLSRESWGGGGAAGPCQGLAWVRMEGQRDGEAERSPQGGHARSYLRHLPATELSKGTGLPSPRARVHCSAATRDRFRAVGGLLQLTEPPSPGRHRGRKPPRARASHVLMETGSPAGQAPAPSATREQSPAPPSAAGGLRSPSRHTCSVSALTCSSVHLHMRVYVCVHACPTPAPLSFRRSARLSQPSPRPTVKCLPPRTWRAGQLYLSVRAHGWETKPAPALV